MNENKVELLGYYGGDLEHACSAWTSTSRNLSEEKKARIPKLLKMLAEAGHHCYDSDTQILTKDGWKFFDRVDENDYVCAVDPKTLEAKFEKPTNIYEGYYNEPMYYVKGQQIDLAVTKGHRMLVSQKRTKDGKEYGEKWECQKSEFVSGKTRKYLKSAFIKNNDVYSQNFAKFIGFFVGDGYVSYKKVRFHIKKKRKIKYLKSLGFKIEERANDTYNVVLNDEQFDVIKLCYNKKKEKCLPLDILKLSHSDVFNILDGLKNSDGSCRQRNKNEWAYYTTSKELKEQLITLSCLHGFVFTERKPCQQNKNHKKCYRLGYSTRIDPEISNMKSRKIGKDYWKWYDGPVYCVTVSTGFIMVRRNGKTIVSGNTPFEKSSIHFLVDTDIASHIHILKHRIGVPVNAESARYKELKEDKYYLPNDWKNINNSKRISAFCGYDYEHYKEGEVDWVYLLEKYTKIGNELYHQCIKDLEPILGRKRAKESARFFKTYNSQIQADVMFNWRSFAHFLSLRKKPDAQKEIREIAEKMLELVKGIEGNPFKHTIEAFGY